MSNAPEIALLFSSFIVLLVVRVPLALCLATSTFLSMMVAGMPPVLVVERLYAALDYFPLLAIPFFILAGFLMNQGNIAERFFDLAQAMVGHIRGGLAQVNVLMSMMFASVSGTASADTAGVGSMVIPAMVKKGYSPGFSAAITAASSTMGAIIPPSVLMIVYGSLANLSITALFMAGIVPGLLVGLSQMAIAYRRAVRDGMHREQRPDRRRFLHAARRAILPMGVPIIIIGGILGAIFTPTEAGVVAVAYAVVLIVILRSISLKELPRITREAVLMVALPTFAIAAAVAFGWMIAFLKVPNIVGEMIEGYDIGRQGGLIFIVLIFLVMGCFIDGVPAMIIFLPIAQKVAAVTGIDPLHMAMVIVMTAALGLVTPPFGLCILIAGKIAGVPTPVIVRETMIFVAAFAALILAIIFIPGIVLFLPETFS
ncbi:TRAP transporter large permease [Cognatishimia maritima]|uniref:TRAP transporter large permease protein n=1 Tax=Cognatishimia maritima TaxID=870908 RepID=A0A1M5WHZ1_9RHOB|nr:TRAP transporter large permease [Cognatishimia maritima]SHH87150.1 TRAP transporter, DctM subunit [Cognatishimia maritima]